MFVADGKFPFEPSIWTRLLLTITRYPRATRYHRINPYPRLIMKSGDVSFDVCSVDFLLMLMLKESYFKYFIVL